MMMVREEHPTPTLPCKQGREKCGDALVLLLPPMLVPQGTSFGRRKGQGGAALPLAPPPLLAGEDWGGVALPLVPPPLLAGEGWGGVVALDLRLSTHPANPTPHHRTTPRNLQA